MTYSLVNLKGGRVGSIYGVDFDTFVNAILTTKSLLIENVFGDPT